jgi:hypothetical protein
MFWVQAIVTDVERIVVPAAAMSLVPELFVTTLIDWLVFFKPVVTSGVAVGAPTTVGVYVEIAL